MKNARFIRRFVENMPADFKGTRKEFKKLIKALLTPPNPNFTWVKDKLGVWNQVPN